VWGISFPHTKETYQHVTCLGYAKKSSVKERASQPVAAAGRPAKELFIAHNRALFHSPLLRQGDLLTVAARRLRVKQKSNRDTQAAYCLLLREH